MKVTQTWALLRWHHILQLAKISVITSKSQINHQHAIEQVIQIGTKSEGFIICVVRSWYNSTHLKQIRADGFKTK